MDTPQPLSESAKLALQTITGEVIKPATTPQEIKAMKLDDYKALCTEMLPDLNAALSDETLQRTLDYIDQDSHLKRNFAPGFTYCPAVIPCGTYGAPLDDEAIKNGMHMRTLMINGQGQTVAGFSQKTTHLFNLLPQEVQANAFSIPTYENPDQYTITDNDRAMVKKFYTDSFRALKKLLS
jgi:hypothetical protein